MKTQGLAFERAAEQCLSQAGLTLLVRNFRSRHGEIDLVMLDQNTLVFVEVRQRSASRFYSAAASVSPKKQARLINTALCYLRQHPEHRHRYCRFDVIAYRNHMGSPLWLKSAFTTG
jgi:putative endonuclease